MTCTRQVKIRPVRIGEVSHPGDYRWSSCHATAGRTKDSLIGLHPIYARPGMDDEQDQYAYRERIANGVSKAELH
jgi:putative transposase